MVLVTDILLAMLELLSTTGVQLAPLMLAQMVQASLTRVYMASWREAKLEQLLERASFGTSSPAPLRSMIMDHLAMTQGHASLLSVTPPATHALLAINHWLGAVQVLLLFVLDAALAGILRRLTSALMALENANVITLPFTYINSNSMYFEIW